MLADLVKEYPKARVVMTHRRPVRALTSLSSLQLKLRSVGTDTVKPNDIAKEVFSLWDAFAARAVDVRRAWAKAAAVAEGAKGEGGEGGEGGGEEVTGGTAQSSGDLLGGASPGPSGGLLDVALEELHTNPMGAVRRIYTAFGLQLSPSAEGRMEAFLADNGREKHGKNRYKTKWFGLGSPKDVLEKYDSISEIPPPCTIYSYLTNS